MLQLQTTLLLLVINFNVIYSVGPAAGPIGDIEIISIGLCSFKNNLKENAVAHLNYNKKLSGNISIPFNFDNNLVVKGLVDKWTGSEWKKNVMKFEGKLCDYLNQYLKKIWTNWLNKMEPKVKGNCVIKKGDYIMNNFEAKAKDMDIPSIIYGKLRATINVVKGKDTILCIEGTADSKSP